MKLGGLLAGAVVATGVGTFLVGSSLATAGEKVTVHPNRPLSSEATNLRDIRANNSPTIVRNPTDAANLAVVNRVDTPRFACTMHVSFDRAATWTETVIPFPESEEQPPRCFGPDLAYGADGTLYTSFVTLIGTTNTPNAVWISSSGDGGRTLSKPVRAAGPDAFQVRLGADPSTSGRIWLTWLQGSNPSPQGFPTPDNPLLAARSDDGGVTWAAPLRVNGTARVRAVAPSPAIGPNGEAYVLYLDVGNDSLDYHGAHERKGGEPYPGPWSLVLARSGDGVTWTETVVDPAVVPTERFLVFFPPAPSVAVDLDDGTVYAAFQDGRDGDADIRVWRSTGRDTFSAPLRVNDTPIGDGSSQYRPRVAVAPNGRVDVVYYDRRADPDDVMNEVSFQSSDDGGRSFGSSVRLTDQPFTSLIGFGSERGMPDLGSRLGLVSNDDSAIGVWSDTRLGTQASNKQDLGFAVVSFSEGSPWRAPLRTTGALLAVAGVMGAVWVASARQRAGVSRRREADSGS